jgi:hypothetical protein
VVKKLRELVARDVLSPQQREQLLKRLWKKSLAEYQVFLWGRDSFLGFVKTLDELHFNQPVRQFPDRPHLRELAKLFAENPLIILFKSRQMQVSWLFCALILWNCLQPGRRWLVVCKKFEAADDLLARMWFIYKKLPTFLVPKAVRKQGFITIAHPEGDSIIQAAAQTSEDPRQYTFTGVWFDEAAWTDNAAQLHAALMPTIQGGGRFIATSSPAGKEYFWSLATEDGRYEI